MKIRPITLLLIVLSSVLIFSAAIAQDKPAESAAITDKISGYAQYLSDRYNLTLKGDVEQKQFTDAAVLINGVVETPADVDLEGFTNLEAILRSVYYVNLDELALTFSKDKTDAVLANIKSVSAELPLVQRQELATALDGGLVDSSFLEAYSLSAPVSADSASYLLGQILELTGQYKHYIGLVSDADIYNRLVYTWQSFDQVLAPELQQPANALIRKGVITGYNLKRTSLNANFDPQLTIVYGHANIDHARQLIALLRSEGLEAKVQLEPKTSAYLYLAAWGKPTVSPEFQVEALDDGNYIAYAKEYDLDFEFNTQENRNRFDTIIKTYAKKNSDDQPGLILGSWRQPLYSSRVTVPDYIEVKNNVVYTGEFYLQSFSLPEKSDAIISSFKADYTDGKVDVWDLWVNEAFHNYLLGKPN